MGLMSGSAISFHCQVIETPLGLQPKAGVYTGVWAPSREILVTGLKLEGEGGQDIYWLSWFLGRIKAQPEMHACWHLDSRFQSMQLDPFQEKTGRWTILPALSVLTHKSTASLKNFSSVCYRFSGFWGCHPHWFCELDILGLCPWVRVIDIWALIWGPIPLLLRSLELGVPSQLYDTVEGRIYGKTGSQTFLPTSVWVFARCVGVT